ncbi:MAG: dehydrogenase [Planctomycetaceae bacterium]|nr:dehydrogenase [Planctomycetaceae bacterium]
MKYLQMNRRHAVQAIAAGALASASGLGHAAAPNDKIRLGIIGLGWRGGILLDRFGEQGDVEIRWLCDADQARLDAAAAKAPHAQHTQDLRQVIDATDVDAVVIATCNHWHCLAAVWAIEAGKDVYVEKPLSHNLREGELVVAAARRHGAIVQLGTQQRSDPMQREVRALLHDEQTLGEIQAVEVCRYGVRESIGRRSEPLPPPASLDVDLWLGPAADEPVWRNAWHYDWHWMWNTGNGEMGNWGVHLIDDVVNVVLRDQLPLPKSVQGGGGRLGWNDAGETPNVHFARLDANGMPVTIGLSNLPGDPGGKKPLTRHGVATGYIVYCEGGRYAGRRGGGVAYDTDGKVIRRFRGTGGEREHVRNFIDAVRSRDPDTLNAEIALGDASTNWSHMANVAFRVGVAGDAALLQSDDPKWRGLIQSLANHAKDNGSSLSSDDIRYSELLSIDAAKRRFVGAGADAANGYLARIYRPGFEFPTAGA